MDEKRYRMGVFDRPILKDWAFWHAVGWSVVVGISTIFDPPQDSTAPLWVDVSGVSAVTFFIVGWPVAGVRRLVRAVRNRNRRHSATPSGASFPRSNAEPRPATTAQAAPETDHSTARPAYEATQPTTSATSRAAPPISLGIYSGEELRDLSGLTQARLELPYPVARAARAVQMTQDPLEQYQYLLDLGEALTLTLGMLSAGWLRQYQPNDPSLGMLHEHYLLRGVSQGHWHEVTKAAEKAMATSDVALPGFVDGVRSRKGDPGAVDALRRILTERNKAAHGARPHNRPEAAVRNAELVPAVIQAVDRAGFLGRTPWVLVEGVALRRHDKRWSARLRRAMGDHPDFDAVTQVVEHALANDTFYVMAEPVPLDLTPMLVIRYCDQCRQPEVCHADRVDEQHGVSLKSFARGHQVFDRDLVVEVNSLLPRDSTGEALDASP